MLLQKTVSEPSSKKLDSMRLFQTFSNKQSWQSLQKAQNNNSHDLLQFTQTCDLRGRTTPGTLSLLRNYISVKNQQILRDRAVITDKGGRQIRTDVSGIGSIIHEEVGDKSMSVEFSVVDEGEVKPIPRVLNCQFISKFKPPTTVKNKDLRNH